jgi:pimeloyl-ACP methyl ester carboxylesterase
VIPEVAGVRHGDRVVRGVRLHVAEAGDPEAPPILLLHGWPHHWWCWRHVVAPLSQEHRLLMPDWRGAGWSDDGPPGTHTPETLAEDALAILDAYGIERAPVIGHDWGCFIGLGLAARRPDRISALVAASTPHPWSRPTPRVAAEAWRTWYAAANAAGAGLRRSASHVLRGVPAMDQEVYLGRVRKPLTTGLYRAYWRLNVQLATAKPPPPITVGLAYLMGEHEHCFSLDLVRSPMPGEHQVEWVRGAGHSIPDTHPRVIVDRALDLVRSAA